MSVLFVSHASKSDAGASTILAWLGEWGYDAVFVDHDAAEGLVGGEPWEERLYTELRRCRALIALVDSAWLGSKWCIAEANHAQALRKPVIPIYLEDRKTSETFAKLLAANAPPVFARVQSLTTVTLEDTKARLKQALSNLGLDAANVFSFKGSRPPYPGLPPFEKDDAPVFFGRDQEITDLLALLNSCRAANRPRWVQIQGASGSGKSSLLRAGLLPRLERDTDHWIILPPFRPLADPLRELSQVLSAPLPAPEGTEAAVVAAWAQWIIDAAASIRTGAQRPQATVLLSIDQLEEAVDPSRAGALRDEDSLDRATLFLIALREALARSDHRLLVISTLRADTIGDFQRHRAMRERSSQGDVIRVEARLIGTLPKASFFAIIQGPADLAGLRFDEGLVGRIVDETATDDALPLLAFALRELWDRYGKADLRISRDEYDLFGGIEKSVGDRAEAEYRNWTDGLAAKGIAAAEIEAQSEEFRRLMFTHFAGITDDGRLIRSPVAWADIPAGLQGIVEAFRDARLMTADQEKVEVAHDALFRRWDRLADWRKQIGGALAELRLVKRIYAERTDPSDLIPDGHQLEQAKRLLASGLIQSDSPLAAFVTSSVKQAVFHEGRRRFWRRLGQAASVAVALVGVIATVLFFVASDRQRTALNERDRAFSSEATRLASLSRAELAKDNSRTAIELALEALPDVGGAESGSPLPGWLRNVFENRSLPVSKTAEGALMEALLKRPLDEPWLVGHKGPISDLAWSPDGKLAATASADGTARIWDTTTGRQERILEEPDTSVVDVQWSPDGSRLATSSLSNPEGEAVVRDVVTGKVWDAATGKEAVRLALDDLYFKRIVWSPDLKHAVTISSSALVHLWDAATGKPMAMLGDNGASVKDVAWSPNGEKFTISAERVSLRDARDGKEIAALPYESAGPGAFWSPDGKKLAIIASSEVLLVVDAGTGKEIVVLRHAGGVSHVAWSPDSTRLAMTSAGEATQIWRLGSAAEMVRVGSVRVGSIAWSPDGTKLAMSSEEGLQIWDAATGGNIGDSVSQKAMFLPPLVRLRWSPDSRYVAVLWPDMLVQLWDVATGQRYSLPGHQGRVSQAIWSPDGKHIATASADGTARIWQVEEQGKNHLRESGYVSHLAWSPGGERIAVALQDGAAHVWDISSAKMLADLKGHDDHLSIIAWNPAGTRLATASRDGTARIWDAADGRQIALLPHDENVTMVAWSPDGARVATYAGDTITRVWEPESGRELARWEHGPGEFPRVVWSPDGKQLVTAASGELHVWVAEAGREVKVLRGFPADIPDIAWSPDGARLLTGSDGHIARIDDAATGELIAELRGHSGAIVRVAWSPDGKSVATASRDHTGRLWDAQTGRELLVLKGHDGDVEDIAWSADGRRLATASADGSIRIWESHSGREISRYTGRGQLMAWDPAGRRLATLLTDLSFVEIVKLPPDNLPLWLGCALGQVPAVSLPDVRDDFYLMAAPQQGSAAAHLSEPYADRHAAAHEACKALLQ